MERCPSCDRPLAGDICPAHGYVGLGNIAVPSPFVRGMIIDFYGATTDIPRGWALCDGTNGTPDLRDRFICGASAGNPVGTAGGSNADHSHASVSVSVSGSTSGTSGGASVTSLSHSLSTNVAVADHATHEHGAGTLHTEGDASYNTWGEGSGSSHNVPAPAHTHTIDGSTGSNNGGIAHVVTQPTISNHDMSHTHDMTGSFSGSGSGSTGGSSIGTNAPAYYALAKIMKL